MTFKLTTHPSRCDLLGPALASNAWPEAADKSHAALLFECMLAFVRLVVNAAVLVFALPPQYADVALASCACIAVVHWIHTACSDDHHVNYGAQSAALLLQPIHENVDLSKKSWSMWNWNAFRVFQGWHFAIDSSTFKFALENCQRALL